MWPVHDGDAVARGRDAQAVLLDKGLAGVVEPAEDLAGLGLELVLLARDEGHDVVDDVHGRDARVAGAGDGLHGDDADGGDGAKGGLQRGKGYDEPDDGAVGVADEEALGEAVDGALVRDEVEVREVDGGNNERNDGVATVVLGVRKDGDLGFEKLVLCKFATDMLASRDALPSRGGGPRLTNIARHVRVEPAKDDVAVAKLGRLALPHHHVGDVAHGPGLLPPDGILVLLARGARRRANGVQLEVRVLREEEDEALADGAGAPEDACVSFRLVSPTSRGQEARAATGLCARAGVAAIGACLRGQGWGD